MKNIMHIINQSKHDYLFIDSKNTNTTYPNSEYVTGDSFPEQIDELIESNAANERNIDLIFKRLQKTFQKYGMVKYDAFDEMGGKLSFTLAMLNERNDGYVLNVVHSREGCFSYVKEIIAGNPILSLSPEEQEALEDALLKDEQ